MKRILLACMLLAVPAILTADEDPLALFRQANGLYEQGDYERAIELYSILESRGRVSADLLYNLGNAYFRTQRPGRAIVRYERALRLAPLDGDIRHNLGFVREAVNEPPLPFTEHLAGYLASLMTLNTLTAAWSVCFILLASGLTVSLFAARRRLLLYLNLPLLCGLLLLSGWLALKTVREIHSRQAVTVAGPAEVRNGPGAESSVGFTLPEGRKVVVLGEKDAWAAVGLPAEGLKGWIEKNYIEEI